MNKALQRDGLQLNATKRIHTGHNRHIRHITHITHNTYTGHIAATTRTTGRRNAAGKDRVKGKHIARGKHPAETQQKRPQGQTLKVCSWNTESNTGSTTTEQL